MRYPYAYEELDEWAEDNVDGSIIEFIPSPRYLRKEKGIDVENYELIRVIAYFKDEEEFHEK